MIAGELPFAIGYKSRLMRLILSNKAHQVLQWIAFNIQLFCRPVFHHGSNISHIMCPDMTFIRTRMQCNATGTRFQTLIGCADQAWYSKVARVAYECHFIEINGKLGAVHHFWFKLLRFEYPASFAEF